MSDYDAIVIGAGHNGLTAAAVMARGGMRVLCLEKNHFIGGMSSSTELVRGYHFELAGSVQFPLPNEIYEDLGFDAVPHLRAGDPIGQHRTVRGATHPPLLGSRKLLAHLGDVIGLEAVLGMAEIAGWAEAPAACSRSVRGPQASQVA